METHYSTVTSKGQVTIPQEVRSALNIRSGDKIAFCNLGGELRLRPKNVDVHNLFGFLQESARVPLTQEEMDDIIHTAAIERVTRGSST